MPIERDPQRFEIACWGAFTGMGLGKSTPPVARSWTIEEEILDGRALTEFSAAHLEFLETLYAYWRELEIEVGAPEPQPLQ